ncbi:MAG: DHH family phosphoesterase [Planctomycetes bacterium]|nr:DHH family phosphoesterase [Planctomycetota bacterium]
MSRPDLESFANILPESGKVVLCTHRHPDPDGLGAIVGIEHLLKQKFGIDSDLVLEGRIRRAENVTMRDLLNIQAMPKGGVNPADYAGMIIVDSQPCFSHTHPPGGIPLLAVFDHHDGIADDSATSIPFEWVDSEFGATSTMVYELLKHHDVKPDKRAATALFCGVRYDTNNLLRGATAADEEAFRTLELAADRQIIGAIDQPPLSREYFQQMHRGINACQDYGTLLLTLMDDVLSPESVAEIADWFLRLEGQQWSLAGGACDGRYQISLRCDMPGADAYPALRYILGNKGACGGHGRMAGGQIELDDMSIAEVKVHIQNRALEFLSLSNVEPSSLSDKD